MFNSNSLCSLPKVIENAILIVIIISFTNKASKKFSFKKRPPFLLICVDQACALSTGIRNHDLHLLHVNIHVNIHVVAFFTFFFMSGYQKKKKKNT